jgi:hypothetical protein
MKGPLKMADKGIIFSGPMVLALLDGRKRQTRRIIKGLGDDIDNVGDGESVIDLATGNVIRMPWGEGDRLYVRERFRFWAQSDDCEIAYHADGRQFQTGPCTGDIPDASLARYFKMVDRSKEAGTGVNYPSIHMPRWASRLWLAVEDVRLERVQDITEADCAAEGARCHVCGGRFPSEDDCHCFHRYAGRIDFEALWDSLHGHKQGERWADNPWIVRTAFTVHKGNIDAELQSAR